MPWVRLTSEPYPRLSVVRDVKDEAGAAYIGPFASASTAQLAVDALHETFPIRQCTRRLPLTAAPGSSACVLAEMGRCGAPCTGQQHQPDYAQVVDRVRHAMLADAAPVVEAHADRIEWLAAQERFEEAATVRDRLGGFLRGASRAQRFAPLAACAELVAARRSDDGGWEIVLVRHGRLAGTARVDRRTDPRPAIATLQATGEQVEPPVAPATAAHPEETDLILAWLEKPGVRLVEVDVPWACPVRSAEAVGDPAAAVAALVRRRPAPDTGARVVRLVAAGAVPAVADEHASDVAVTRPVTLELDDARVIPLSIRPPRTA
jgi:DNA polymerase-3 subunit epsilon